MIKTTEQLRIEPAAREDYPKIVDLIRRHAGYGPEPEQLWQREQTLPQQAVRMRMTLRLGPKFVGLATIQRWPGWVRGRYDLMLVVDPEYRRRGLGTIAYDVLETRVREMGCTELWVECWEHDTESVTFAQKRGFETGYRMFESILDLESFDPHAHDGLIRRLESEGVRFCSLESAADVAQAKRDMHAVYSATDLDCPGEEHDEPKTYEEFEDIVYRAYWYWPAGQWLAYDGAAAVAHASVGPLGTGEIYNLNTGVLRSHRGRGLGLAIKVHALLAAQRAGYAKVRTNNASQNIAMIRINDRLGYQPQPGWLYMKKDPRNKP